MVNNIAANVLGGKPELEDGAEMEGVYAMSPPVKFSSRCVFLWTYSSESIVFSLSLSLSESTGTCK